MTTQLTESEIKSVQQLLAGNIDAQKALDILEKNDGRLDASFDELWEENNGTETFTKGKSLWKVMLGEIRKELCGNDGFRGKVKEYTNNPGLLKLG